MSSMNGFFNVMVMVRMAGFILAALWGWDVVPYLFHHWYHCGWLGLMAVMFAGMSAYWISKFVFGLMAIIDCQVLGVSVLILRKPVVLLVMLFTLDTILRG